MYTHPLRAVKVCATDCVRQWVPREISAALAVPSILYMVMVSRNEVSWFEGNDSIVPLARLSIANPSPLSSFVIFRFGPLAHPCPPLYNTSSSLHSCPVLFLSTAMARSPIHHASLVDPALHSPALLELLNIKLSRQVLGMSSLLVLHSHQLNPFSEYVVDSVVDTVDYAMGRPSSSRLGRAHSRRSEHASFVAFVHDVLTRAEVTISTILVSLVYINRAKPHLQIALEEWACERVFLGAIMVASKVHCLFFSLPMS